MTRKILTLWLRLTESQIEVIKQTAKQIFDENAYLCFFGFRIYDNKKGGDIDLLIKTPDKLFSQSG